MYGPTGIGVLYGKYELLEKMPPFKSGGDMIERVSFECITYQKPPLKFEAGTPMIAEAIGLAAAVDYLNALGVSNIHAHEQKLTDYAFKQLQKIPHLHILGTAKERGSLITFYVQGVHSLDLGTILNLKGVCVRTGLMCAEPYFRSKGISSGVRISFGVYSTFKDVDYFIKMLKESLFLIKPEISF
jgi:cysteine desulfurase/selenocysteine lyase